MFATVLVLKSALLALLSDFCRYRILRHEEPTLHPMSYSQPHTLYNKETLCHFLKLPRW